ncbi:MAG TPA: high frequency lysogenization protein HflD, partial [Kiloniellales bacterium]
IRPCSGAIIILLFTLAQGVFLAGIGATFAMALGTATTVAALAIFTVVARRMALRLVQSNGIWENHMSRGLSLLGASAVLVFGILLLFASIGRNNPFL